MQRVHQWQLLCHNTHIVGCSTSHPEYGGMWRNIKDKKMRFFLYFESCLSRCYEGVSMDGSWPIISMICNIHLYHNYGFITDDHTSPLGYALGIGWSSTIDPWWLWYNYYIKPLPVSSVFGARPKLLCAWPCTCMLEYEFLLQRKFNTSQEALLMIVYCDQWWVARTIASPTH